VVLIHNIVAAKSDPSMPEADQVLHCILGGIPRATAGEVDVFLFVAVGNHRDVHTVFRDIDRDVVRFVIDPENEAVNSTARKE
jgi:hypothetical protein